MKRAPDTGGMGSRTYTNARLIPGCVDHKGHHFTIPPMTSNAVCTRCGLIRKDVVSA